MRPILILGPTASGKSALSIALAQALDGEIINIDSMQLYQGMDIGTAKVTEEEQQGIAHHLLDIWPVTRDASVSDYQARAVAKTEELLAKGRQPIIVGGSMLYIQALVDAFQFPPTDKAVRAQFEQRLAEVGIDQLHRELAAIDPAAAKIIEDKDPRRTVRALEVNAITGQPFPAAQPERKGTPRWNTLLLGLRTTSEWLHPRIEQRTKAMFEQGFEEEVRGLVDRGLVADSTAGRAIGYAQILAALEGRLPWGEVEERTTIGTRRYVRRQRSWFARDPRIHWIDAHLPTLPQAQDLIEAES